MSIETLAAIWERAYARVHERQLTTILHNLERGLCMRFALDLLADPFVCIDDTDILARVIEVES